MLPPDTLSSLRAAVHAEPADRAVRLVYADALEENGDPADLPRAEFIRGQVSLEDVDATDPTRAVAEAKCRALFSTSWPRWWAEYCTAAGLPRPHVTSGGFGAWLARAIRVDSRRDGDPYRLSPGGFTLRCDPEHFAVEFTGGFPDSLYLYRPRDDYDRLFAVLPVARLALCMELGLSAWEEIDGPNLRRLASLHLDAVDDVVASHVSASANLADLPEIVLRRPRPHAVSGLLSRRVRANLRRLTLSHVEDPRALSSAADAGEFARLTELTVEVVASLAQAPDVLFEGLEFDRLLQLFSTFPRPPAAAAPADAFVGMMNELADALRDRPPDGRGWGYFCAALGPLVRSPMCRRLTHFRLRLGEDLLSAYRRGEPNLSRVPLRPLSDDCAAALGDGFGEALRVLEVPAKVLTPAQRRGLEIRWGPRFRVV